MEEQAEYKKKITGENLVIENYNKAGDNILEAIKSIDAALIILNSTITHVNSFNSIEKLVYHSKELNKIVNSEVNSNSVKLKLKQK